jgi:hypothetical protein
MNNQNYVLEFLNKFNKGGKVRHFYEGGEIDFGDMDFGDVDFGGMDFGDLDLGDIDLGDVDLGGLDLGDVDLGSLDLGDIDLGGLDLGDIDLGDIDLGGTDIGDIDLGSADLGSTLTGGNDIGDIDLGGASTVDLNELSGGDSGGKTTGDDLIGFGMDDEDFGSTADLGSFEDIAAADFAGSDERDTSYGTQGDADNSSNPDFGSKADLGSFEDMNAADNANRGYYDEETGKFVYDPNGPLNGPLDETSGTNIESMKGYTYDKKTGTWTTPSGEVYKPKVAPTHTAKSGAQVMVDAGALPSGYNGLTPTKGSTADIKGGGGTTTTTGPGGGTTAKTGEKGDNSLLMFLLMMMMMNQNKGGGGGSSTVIPGLTATQKQTPYSQQQAAAGYRPGQGGISYFQPTQYAPKMASGGIARLLKGPGDGVSDSIPAVITDGMSRGGQPAKVARGEYIIDARTVAALGNGSTDAGAERLDKMRRNILRDDRKAGVGKDSRAYRHLLA